MTEQSQDLVVVDAELVDEPRSGRAVTLPVLDGEAVEESASPALWPAGLLRTAGGMTLRGGIVTDLGEIEAIRARIEHYSQPWWRRSSSRRSR